MVLGFGGVLGLSGEEYKQHLKQQSIEQLRTQEVVELRRQFSASVAIGGGTGTAPFTHGLSPNLTGVAARRYSVHKRKL